uniref:Alpha subunit of RNA polymerase n=1 Tax=Klebsormidium flaccidum TaxID=3175 RepID=A0A024B3I7_KLEFL|nr:alpha subunit of RNA polymerase [Klebsormidium flaccidum]AHZ11005.1 alpha subunit of RNA polymerase [Klebsormidium flaccidum]
MTPTSRYRVQSLQQVQISTSLHHERIMLAPLSHSEATTLAVGLRRCLLKGFEGTCFSTLKIRHSWLTKREKKCYEYLALPGIRETVRDIMMNLSSVVLVGMPMKGKTAVLKTDQKVGVFEAKHIILPEGIHCLSPNQTILTVVVPLELELELTIERGSGFRIRDGGQHEEGLLLDARFNPILQVDYQIQKTERRTGFDFNENASRLKKEMISDTFYQKDSHFIKKEQIKNELSKEQSALTFEIYNEQEQDHFYLLLFDIWTNGTIQPIEAMQRAARQAIAVYIPLLRFALTGPSNILVHKQFDSKNNYVKKMK